VKIGKLKNGLQQINIYLNMYPYIVGYTLHYLSVCNTESRTFAALPTVSDE
jgi:hypothetical protein